MLEVSFVAGSPLQELGAEGASTQLEERALLEVIPFFLRTGNRHLFLES